MYEYKDNGAVDNTIPADLDKIKNKSVVITGGSSGFGEAYVKAFVDAGSDFVVKLECFEC